MEVQAVLGPIPVTQVRQLFNVRTETLNINVDDLLQSIPENCHCSNVATSCNGKTDGLLQAIGLRKLSLNQGYMLMWGNRRFKALLKLGVTELLPYTSDPVNGVTGHYVVTSPNMTEVDFIITNTIENTRRVQISPIELGRVVCFLHDEAKMSLDDIAKRLSEKKHKLLTAVSLYKRTPKGYEKYVGYAGPGRTQSADVIPSSTMSFVTSFIPEKDRPAVLDAILKKQIPFTELNILKLLLSSGVPVQLALQEMDKYDAVQVQFLVRIEAKDALEKERSTTIQDIIKQSVVQGTHLRRDLVFDPKVAAFEAGPTEE